MTYSPPAWISTPCDVSQEWITITDVVSVDTTSPAAMQTGSAILNGGIIYSGELSGQTIQLFSPFGLYSLPVPGTLGNVNGGSQVLAWVRNDEYYAFAGRDVTTQKKAGPVVPGGVSLYAPGAPDGNRVIFDINGNLTITTTTQTTIHSQTVNVEASPINLGSSSPSDAVARASVTDSNFKLIATSMGGVPITTPAQAIAAINALIAAFLTPPSTASGVAKLSG